MILQVEQKELIDNKPYFGIFFSTYIILNHALDDIWHEDSRYKVYIDRLRNSIPKDLGIRKESIIYRPPYILGQNGTLAIKGILWGRAFKVMKTLKKGSKTYKKVYVGGKRKRVRVL